MKEEIMKAYVGIVLKRFYITEKEFFKKNKSRRFSNARYLFYYLCRDRDISVVDIQLFMSDNGYDIPHSTIVHGANVMKSRVEEDRDYKGVVKDIKERIELIY